LRQNKGLSLDASQQPANIHSTFARLDPWLWTTIGRTFRISGLVETWIDNLKQTDSQTLKLNDYVIVVQGRSKLKMTIIAAVDLNEIVIVFSILVDIVLLLGEVNPYTNLTSCWRRDSPNMSSSHPLSSRGCAVRTRIESRYFQAEIERQGP
jgi:hypothetical protein